MARQRKYSDEFKREAVGLIRKAGSKVTQVAADIGVTATQLFRWRRELDGGCGKGFLGSGVARD